MKRQIISANTKLVFNSFFLAIVLLASSLLVKAAVPEDKIPATGNTAEVKYIGRHNDQQLFNVLYNNVNGGRFSVRIEDQDGYLLFQDSYTDKKFDKKFRLIESPGKLVFIIRNYSDNSVQLFEVNSDVRTVEDVVVTKAN